MKWVDYRESLGIGFSDNQKLSAFISKLNVMFDSLHTSIQYQRLVSRGYAKYFMMVGEIPYQSRYDSIGLVYDSIAKEKDLRAVISKCVAFINTAGDAFYDSTLIDNIKTGIMSYLYDLNIPFELVIDDDGIFIFPKGVPEMDDALVSEPLDWLKDYPKAEKAWSKALREYAEVKQENASDVADLFRKALEAFFQEVFDGGKSLENYKSEYGSFLKANGVPQEIANNFVTLMDAFAKYNNNYAKHHDKAELNILEYLMYQTGNIIRLVITLKQEEAQ